jgi:glycosyltransferase involved in cell wall biosynthesis
MMKRLPADYEIKISKDYAEPEGCDLVYFNFYRRVKEVPIPSVAPFTHIEEKEPALAERFFTAAEKVDHAIVHCNLYRDRLINRGIPKEKITVVGISVDHNLFTPKIRIGIAARKHRSGRKGEALLSEFLKNITIPREFIKLIIVGRDWDEWVKEHKQYVEIDYRGFVSWESVRDMMREIDYYLCMSEFEGMCIPLLEAAACGKAIITRPVGVAIDDMFDDGLNVFKFDTAQDLDKLFDKLIMGKRRIVEKFTWENYAKVHDTVFRSTVKERNNKS